MNIVTLGFYLALIYWPIKTIFVAIRQRSLDNDFDFDDNDFDDSLPFLWGEEDNKVWCKSCKGHGGTWKNAIKYVECPKCDGWGHTYE